MRIQPHTPERLNSDRLMALCTHRLGRFDQARILYERVLAADPDSVSALNNLAYLLTQDMDKPGEGLPYAQQANRLAPNDPQVLDTLGWAQFKTGQSAEALKTLRRSLDMADLPASNYHLGEVLLAANQKLDAVRYFEKARDMAQAAKENDIAKAAADRLSALKG